MTITILTFLLIRCRSDRPRGDSIELLSLLSVRQIRPNWAQVGAHSTTVPFYYFFQRSFSNFSPASAQNTSERSHFTKLFSKKILFIIDRVVLSDSFIVNSTSAKTWRNSKKKPSDIKVHISGAQVILKITPSSKKDNFICTEIILSINPNLYTQLLNYKTVNYKKRAVLYVMIFCTYIFASLASRKE
jgi:hypothetical protein